VSAADVILLVVAGVAAGLTGSVAGMASLFSYPTLLAVGLSPVTANVTNSVALIFSTVGAVAGSRPELSGQGRRVRPLALAGLAGGIAGGVLLLSTPSEAFEKIVPFLIAAASVAILVRRPLVAAAEHDHRRHGRRVLIAGTGLIGVYGGYFGAGGGVMMLALFLWALADPLPRANAFKNVVLGTANGAAAVLFVFFGDVRWSAVVPLGAGVLVGGRLGPIVVRRVPSTPLRVVIAVAGIGLATKLAVDAFG
jgi:uncharacterized protein